MRPFRLNWIKSWKHALSSQRPYIFVFIHQRVAEA